MGKMKQLLIETAWPEFASTANQQNLHPDAPKGLKGGRRCQGHRGHGPDRLKSLQSPGPGLPLSASTV